jgi:hypothetical protein
LSFDLKTTSRKINAFYIAESDEAIEGSVCENSNKETAMLARISEGRNSN